MQNSFLLCWTASALRALCWCIQAWSDIWEFRVGWHWNDENEPSWSDTPKTKNEQTSSYWEASWAFIEPFTEWVIPSCFGSFLTAKTSSDEDEVISSKKGQSLHHPCIILDSNEKLDLPVYFPLHKWKCFLKSLFFFSYCNHYLQDQSYRLMWCM